MRETSSLRTRSSPHRILFVEGSLGGVLGGSLTGILHLIRRIDRSRFAPALAIFEPKDGIADLQARGIPVHLLPPLPAPLARGKHGRLGRALVRARELAGVIVPRARTLADFFRRERPDLVYLANGVTSNLDCVLAAAFCRLPILCHEKGFRRVGFVERTASRWVESCVCMTDEIAAHYRDRGLRPRRFLTIYDGIDCEEFAPGGGDAIRREFGIPSGVPLVGIVGHIQSWKGQLLAVEAVARARERHPDLRCLIVGGVHRQGADYAAQVRARIAADGLAQHVVLTGARSDVPACIDAMDVVVHSSTRREPFGRVLIEAMALGRPLIAPREGGPREIVVDGETGLLVQPRDAGALADAITRLVADPELRRAMGRAARARVDAVFDIRHHVRAIEALFDEMLASRQARGD
jgi:glycosyltransferase involved in cell wall biosynthesis